MYVLTITENNELKYFSNLSYNGIFTDSDIHRSVIFTSSSSAASQSAILHEIDANRTFTVKQITLQDIS
jgi:hypothetical protein